MTPAQLRAKIDGNTRREGECRVWQGALTKWGSPRGRLRPGGPIEYVRRVKLEQVLGKPQPPDRPLGVATCDTAGCVADAHLDWWSTHQLQLRAAPKGGRSIVRNARIAVEVRARLGKLTMDKAREMRAYKAANPHVTTWQLGPMFGITQRAAADVIAGRTWKEYGLFTGLMGVRR